MLGVGKVADESFTACEFSPTKPNQTGKCNVQGVSKVAEEISQHVSFH